MGQLSPYPEAVIEVRGLFDPTGREANDPSLATQRAESVARRLVDLGVGRHRIVTSGSPAQTGGAPGRRVDVTVR